MDPARSHYGPLQEWFCDNRKLAVKHREPRGFTGRFRAAEETGADLEVSNGGCDTLHWRQTTMER
jgi:hypothetical protein